METSNKERILIKILKELSKELNIKVDFFCYNWLVRVQHNQTIKHIMGYDWEINSATSQLIAKDKSACYEILISQNIPAIEHTLFLSPQFQDYISGNGSWKDILKYAQRYNYPLVCKPNIGTGGNEVFKIMNQKELEIAVHTLFSKNRGICLCPYYEIENEYRLIILNGQIQLVYLKQKPYVIGNGTSTVLELLKQGYGKISWNDLQLQDLDLMTILLCDEKLELGWKHNLGKGANPVILNESKINYQLAEITLNAAKAINISFASVDVAECNNELRVIEINSGIMMENFAQQGDNEYNLAKNIYKNALKEMFKGSN